MTQMTKRILAMALTAVLLLSALPAGMEGPVEAKAAEDGIVLFDDAFSNSIKSADMSNVTVLDNIPGPDGDPTSVISLAGGWSLSRFGTGSTALDITPAVEKSGNLVLDIYASYATADAEIRVYTAAWQGAKVSFFRALNQGWNTITIPVSEIGSNDFYGIGIVSHTGTCYVDNVRFAWQGRSIQIDVQPVGAELQLGESTLLSISASLSDGSDASGLRYHWYECDDLNRTNPIFLDVPFVPTCRVLPANVGIHYFYCQITGEGLQSVYSDVITVTARFPDNKQNLVIFDDAFSDSVKPADQSGLSVLENIPGADGSESNVISLSGGWSLGRFGTGQTPLDITDAVAEEGALIFDIYVSYATTDTEIRVYTAAWQGAQTSFTYALAAGWNTVTIPATQIGSTDFYGIGILSHTSTCYVDNVRFVWDQEPDIYDEFIHSGTCGPNASWGITEQGRMVIYGTGEMTDYTYATVPWGKYRNDIKTLVVEDGITSIGEYSFHSCKKMTAVTLPDSITRLGSDSFSQCVGLTEFQIPKGVTVIEEYIFYGCTGLTSITIPEKVTKIARYSFYSCTGLTSVTIPESVTTIDNWAFGSCTGLTQFTIPDTVTSLGSGIVTDCTGLTEFTIPDRFPEIPSSLLEGCTGLTSIVIPEGVTAIGFGVFKDCSNLVSVTIPDSVTTIGGFAFSGCRSLTAIDIPAGVTAIGGSAFYQCSGLTGITIPEGITTIENWTFQYCTGLTEITIPAGVTTIVQHAFSNCTSLEKITFHSEVPPALKTDDASGSTVIFNDVTATVYYPDTEAWTEAFRQSCGGDVTWKPLPSIRSASVTLDAALGVNFKAPSGYDMTVTVGGEEYPVTEGDGVYTVSVFAQDMTRDIVATLTDPAGNVLDTQTFRLSDYVADIGNGNNSAEMKALAAATLNYCRYAAKLKGNYDGEMPQLDAIPENAFDGCKITASGTLTDVRAFAYLEDACQIGLRLPVAEGYGVTVNGETVDVSDGVCYTPRMLPQEYDSDYTFVVTRDGAEHCQVSISVLTYLNGAFQNNICGDDADMENLLIAMYHYYAAAEAVASGTAA